MLIDSNEPYVKKKYINCQSFEIYDEKPENVECFEVDEKIADTISSLNKKGYYTSFCCQGHSSKTRTIEYTESKWYTEIFERRKLLTPDNGCKILEESEDKLRIFQILGGHDCYILFESNTELPNLPEGFTSEISKDGTHRIFHPIKTYFVQNNEPVSMSEEQISAQIDRINKVLYEWTTSLELCESKKERLK